VTHINTRQDLARWTRAHADARGITWSVLPGQGGTMVIVDGEADRSTLTIEPEAEAAL
jgi:hypothetical protein